MFSLWNLNTIRTWVFCLGQSMEVGGHFWGPYTMEILYKEMGLGFCFNNRVIVPNLYRVYFLRIFAWHS